MPGMGITQRGRGSLRTFGVRSSEFGVTQTHKAFAIGLFLLILSSTLFAQNPTTRVSTQGDSFIPTHNSERITHNSDIQNSLVVSSTQNPSHFPYRDATLTVRNTTGMPIAAVRLRWQDGGPAMQFPMAISPGQTAERSVYLPAMSGMQTYDIALLPTDNFTAQPAGHITLDVHWPVDLLTKDIFLDPAAFRANYIPPPKWSNSTKMSALFFGVILTLFLTAVLLIRRRQFRLYIGIGVILLLLAGAFVWIHFFGGGAMHEVSLPHGRLIQVRRTGEYHLRNLTPQYAPVYSHEYQIDDETLIVHPEKGSCLTLYPGETRFFSKRRERESDE